MAVADMSQEHGFAMRQFTAGFAFDQGQRLRDGEEPWNLFAAGLLLGEPMRLWAAAFEMGARHRDATLDDEFDVLQELGFFHRGPVEEAIRQAVDDALLQIEMGFEQAYARLGFEGRRSLLAGTRRALSGWFYGPDEADLKSRPSAVK